MQGVLPCLPCVPYGTLIPPHLEPPLAPELALGATQLLLCSSGPSAPSSVAPQLHRQSCCLSLLCGGLHVRPVRPGFGGGRTQAGICGPRLRQYLLLLPQLTSWQLGAR